MFRRLRHTSRHAIDLTAEPASSLRRPIADHDLIVANVLPYVPVLTAKLCPLLSDRRRIMTWHEV